MRYYKLIKDDILLAIGVGSGGVEITEDEYNSLLAEIRTKSGLADSLYNGEITISDVPIEWQKEIQQMVDDRIDTESAAEEQEISDTEALNIIVGGDI